MDTIINWLNTQQSAFAEQILDIKLRAAELKDKEQQLSEHAQNLKSQEKELEQFRKVSFISSMNKQMQKKDVRIRQLERKIRKLEAKVQKLSSKQTAASEQDNDLIIEDVNMDTATLHVSTGHTTYERENKSPSPQSVPSEVDEKASCDSLPTESLPGHSPVIARTKSVKNLHLQGTETTLKSISTQCSHSGDTGETESQDSITEEKECYLEPNEVEIGTKCQSTESKDGSSNLRPETPLQHTMPSGKVEPMKTSESKHDSVQNTDHAEDTDEDLYISPDNQENPPKLREFQKIIDNVRYIFRELKQNKGKLYKVRKNGTVNKRKSGTFRIKPGAEIAIKWN